MQCSAQLCWSSDQFVPNNNTAPCPGPAHLLLLLLLAFLLLPVLLDLLLQLLLQLLTQLQCPFEFCDSFRRSVGTEQQRAQVSLHMHVDGGMLAFWLDQRQPLPANLFTSRHQRQHHCKVAAAGWADTAAGKVLS